MGMWALRIGLFLAAALLGWWLRGRVELKGSIKSEVELWQRAVEAARKINTTRGDGFPW